MFAQNSKLETLSAYVGNYLQDKGFEGFRPYTGTRTFGVDIIYHPCGEVRLSGRFGFQVLGDIPEDFIKACKKAKKAWQAEKAKLFELENQNQEEIPF